MRMNLRPSYLSLLLGFVLFTSGLYAQYDSPYIVTPQVYNGRDVACLDADQDGYQDILVVNNATRTLALFINDGSGDSYEYAQSLVFDDAVNDLRTGDFNGDGMTDLVTSHYELQRIMLHLNQGDGSFSDPILVAENPSNASEFYGDSTEDNFDIGDMDGDGDLDIASTRRDWDRVIWWRNDGTGHFGVDNVVDYTSDGAGFMRLVDMDDDGDLDIVTTHVADDFVSIYPNNGIGLFDWPTVIAGEYFRARGADMDLDGLTDIVAFENIGVSGFKMVWLPALDSTSYGPPQELTELYQNFITWELNDLDQDGDKDIFFTSYVPYADTAEYELPSTIFMIENLGSGLFSEPLPIPCDRPYVLGLDFCDMDNDGDPDFLASSSGLAGAPLPLSLDDNSVIKYENLGSGQLGSEELIPSTKAKSFAEIDLADLDGDGDLDILAAAERHIDVFWYENDGNGRYLVEHELPPVDYEPINQIGRAIAVHAMDVDADGDMDVISSRAGNTGSPDFDYVGSQIIVHTNDGEGNFSYEAQYGTESLEGDEVRHFYNADLDNDGDEDLLFSQLDYRANWKRNDGTGIFSDTWGIYLCYNNRHTLTADMDGDGLLDIICNGTNIIFNNGTDEPFGPGSNNNETLWIDLPPINNIRAIDIADWDEDGDTDILIAGYGDGKIVLVENLGELEFTYHILTEQALSPFFIRFNDMDGDGDLDVLYVTRENQTVSWLKNQGYFFDPDPIVIMSPPAATDWPLDVEVGDLDNDSDLDIVVVGDYTIRTLENRSGEGCTDPAACNFDPSAYADDLSCCYSICGCPDSTATNYDPAADCNIGSCLYDVTGMVFFDENEDGVYN
ncbi:MAG: VCBS repeat-containing protein, partial [Flavobacteriales bacterium]|nr:VCBS repeat-containing protein [Flavobacteriales bacterium]